MSSNPPPGIHGSESKKFKVSFTMTQPSVVSVDEFRNDAVKFLSNFSNISDISVTESEE